MPSKSPAQAKLMRAAAHNSQFALKAGVPQKVARDFVAADKGRKPPPDFGTKDEEAAEGDPRADSPAEDRSEGKRPPPKKGGGQFDLPKRSKRLS